MRKISAFFILVFLFTSFAKSAYFVDIPMTVVQPNGDTLHCFASGDEFYHWLHDAEGFTIVKDSLSGYYVYADKVNDELIPTSFIAGKADPQIIGLVPNLKISSQKIAPKRDAFLKKMQKQNTNLSKAESFNTGTLNNIVVFISFKDQNNDFENNYSFIESMFNNQTDGFNSMINYYHAVSYDKLTISTSLYPSPTGENINSYKDINNRNYYLKKTSDNPDGYEGEDERTEREHYLLKRAVDYVKTMIPSSVDVDFNDDGYVDNVCFVIKGSVGDWSDLLWPHRWSLYSEDCKSYINEKRVWDYNLVLEGAVGYFNTSTLCHEMFHTLGAPDLYHYVSDYGSLKPVYKWDLMAQNGTPPQHSTAYMKYKYGGWIDEIPEITECGTYSLKPLSSSSTKNCYKIASSNADEFYVLEYRLSTDETALNNSGLLIYRVNTNFNGNSEYDGTTVFDEIYVFRKDGSEGVNGNVDDATFCADLNRTHFDSTSNPYPFLTDGTIDNIVIRNISEIGDSITFNFCPKCSTPSDCRISSIYNEQYPQGAFYLSWTYNPEVDSYNVYVDGVNYKIDSNSVIFPYDANQPYDVEKCFTISADCEINVSEGVQVCSSMHNPNSCYAPQSLDADVENSTITLSWLPAFNAVSYDVFRDGAKIDSNVTDTSYFDSTLLHETQYCYQVLTVCSEGESELSSTVCKTTETIECGKVVGVTAQKTENLIVSWQAVPNAISYSVYRNGSIIAEDVLENYYADNSADLTENTYSYCYEIKAKCADNVYSVSSDEYCVTANNVNENDLTDLSIFPNPAKSVLNINNSSNILSIEIISTTGNVLLSKTVFQNKTEIDVSAFAQGLYYLQIKTDNGTAVKKISIEK